MEYTLMVAKNMGERKIRCLDGWLDGRKWIERASERTNEKVHWIENGKKGKQKREKNSIATGGGTYIRRLLISLFANAYRHSQSDWKNTKGWKRKKSKKLTRYLLERKIILRNSAQIHTFIYGSFLTRIAWKRRVDFFFSRLAKLSNTKRTKKLKKGSWN